MPYNGSGVFLRLENWTNDAAANIKIRADRHDIEDDNFASGLTQCITKDGQTTITANLPMAGFKHTNVGNGTATTDYAAAGQVRNSSLIKLASVSGTDTITANAAITLTAYAEGQMFNFKATGTNTGATTINIDALGAKTIQKSQSALVAGDITSGDSVQIYYDGTNFQLLSPPRTPNIPSGSIPLTALATQAANTFVANATAGAASPTASVALSASNLAGRGSTGNLAAISLGAGLTMTGTSLDVTTTPPVAASQADQETGTSTTTFVSPGRQQFHLAHPKAVLKLTTLTTTPTVTVLYNALGTITPSRTGTGDHTISWANTLTNPMVQLSLRSAGGSTPATVMINATGGLATTSLRTKSEDRTGSAYDPTEIYVTLFGDL